MNQHIHPVHPIEPISAFQMEENGEEIRIYRFSDDPDHIGFEIITGGFIHGSRMKFSDLKELLASQLGLSFQDTLNPQAADTIP